MEELVKVTLKQIAAFKLISGKYIDTQGAVQNKLTYAIQKINKNIAKHYDKYQEDVMDVRAEFALIKDGAFVLDKGEYQTDPAKVKDFTTKIRAINNIEVEIKPFLVKKEDLPKKLEIAWYEFFIPFVIDELSEPVEELEESKA